MLKNIFMVDLCLSTIFLSMFKNVNVLILSSINPVLLLVMLRYLVFSLSLLNIFKRRIFFSKCHFCNIHLLTITFLFTFSDLQSSPNWSSTPSPNTNLLLRTFKHSRLTLFVKYYVANWNKMIFLAIKKNVSFSIVQHWL